uniref:Uncharacterized protein n=1 Tax=viral metagenome TaxID=1070528 RepID=A0A6C0CU09_9ZZZZ
MFLILIIMKFIKLHPTIHSIIVMKMISVALEFSYRKICAPMDSFYHFFISLFSSSSEACGTIRTLAHQLNFVVVGMIMKWLVDTVEGFTVD